MRKNMKKSARVLSRKIVFRGRVFYVTSERVREPRPRDGAIEVRRDIVHHPGSVVVMAIDRNEAEPRILLERQYRFAARQRLWELPAGRIDEAEHALAAAKRELMEETGYRASRWKLAMRFWSSPGFLDEQMALYVASGLRRGHARPEEDEVITKTFLPLSAARRMVMNGKIRDAKTIAGILWLAQKQR
jgi:ADP-ribose pyrophosphatase